MIMSQMQSSFNFGLSTHPGVVKKNNEDSVFLKLDRDVDGEEIAIMLVADGMGGYHAGEVASKLVADTIHNWWQEQNRFIFESSDPLTRMAAEIEKLLHDMNNSLIERSQWRKIGTTVSLLVSYKNCYLICHVGDSRIYHISSSEVTLSSDEETEDVCKLDRDETEELLQGTETLPLAEFGALTQLTEDHSWVELQLKNGLITEAEAQSHPQRNVLLQCLGIKNQVKPYITEGSYKVNDLFLLCSDGFYTLFTKEEIERLLQSLHDKYEDLQQISDHLVELANQRGAKDNVTVALLRQRYVSEKPGIKKFISKLIKTRFNFSSGENQ
jgi:PPM family protein phosphatase